MLARFIPLFSLALALGALAACSRGPAVAAAPAPVPAVVAVVAAPRAAVAHARVADAALGPKMELDLKTEEALPSILGVDHRKVAEQLVSDGRPGEAVESFRHALSSDASAAMWTRLGDAYLKAGQRDKGAACLEEAIRLDDGHAAARVSLVRSYLDSSKPELARFHAEQLVRQDPTSTLAQSLVGRAYMQLAMWKQAMAAYTIVATAEPGNIWAQNNLGYSALQVGENEIARGHLEALLTLQGQQPFMLNNLGVAYERLGRNAEALAAFSRSAELRPSYVKAVGNRDRIVRGLSIDEQVLAAEVLLEMREALDQQAVDVIAAAGPVGGGAHDASPGAADAGVELMELGGGGVSSAIMAPSNEPVITTP